jgi:hypothetical protein
LSSFQDIWGNGDASALNGFLFRFDDGNKLDLYDISGSVQWRKVTTQVFRDASAWYHFVISYNTANATAADRVRIYVNGVRIDSFSSSSDPSLNYDGYINNTNAHSIGRTGAYNGLYLNGYLADIHFIDGQALDPTSFGEFDANGIWQPIAYSGGSYGTNGFHLDFADNSTAAALGTDTSGNGNTWTVNNFQATVQTGRLYAQASGTSTSAFSSATLLGNFPATVGGSYAIYDADLVTPVTSATFSYLYSFGSVVEVLVSADGTNWTSKGNQSSSYTTVSHTSAFRYVRWFYSTFNFGITNNPAQNDSLVDVPTNGSETDTGVGGEVRGNYATLNPLDNGGLTLSNGNLDFTNANAAWDICRASFFVNSGKWYWEVQVATWDGSGAPFLFGIANAAQSVDAELGQTSNSWCYLPTGQKRTAGSTTSYGSAMSTGAIVGVALDMDAGTLTFYLNGVSQGTAFTSITGSIAPAVSVISTAQHSGNFNINFGQRPFAYTAPSGFKALNTANLPAPVITKPSTVMDVKLYTGNGSTQTISGLGFSPDLVWCKSRSAAASHILFDALRGRAGLLSNGTSDEITPSAGSDFDALTSDGFTLLTPNSFAINTNSASYVAWTWDAGSSTVTNTQGSISSQVRANASAGFSIVSYTGTGSNATVGHGLGVAPALIIFKNRNPSGGYDWLVYSSSLVSASYYLTLNTTNAAINGGGGFFNNTAPTSTVFSIGTTVGLNESGKSIIAYCFAPVAGYSSFGSYTGNGSSSSSPFVFTGFSPRFVLLKNASQANTNWVIHDTARQSYNTQGPQLVANSSSAEYTELTLVDILSNGFSPKRTVIDYNANGDTYIYAAFAESPFQYARAR